MGPTIGEVFRAVAAQEVSLTGPWFTHHFRRPGDTFDFEACVPVATPIAPVGRVQPSQWPEMRVVRTVYHGPYEGLGEAWAEFLDRIEADGLKIAEDLWECYLTGRESDSDPTRWRTQLSKRLLD